MSLRVTGLLSVSVVILSIIAHQCDPEIIPTLLSIGYKTFEKVAKDVTYYYNSVMKDVNKYLGFDEIDNSRSTSQKSSDSKKGSKKNDKKDKKKGTPPPKIFTKEELKQYNGEEGSKGIYVGILGSVFDVESGKQHYGSGGGYHFFAGIDGTRAFVSGEFTESGLIDDVTGLKPKDLKSLHGWYKFYMKDYTYVGKVVGNFYDASGKPTAELKRVLKVVKEVEESEAEANKENMKFPPCNVEWNQEQGLRVWCTTKSGGVERSWVGVPHRMIEAGQKSRCVCLEPESEAATDPRVGQYAECTSGEVSCWVSDSKSTTRGKPRKMSAKKLLSVDFEVFGRVQGVFFRKHTVQTGKKLGLRGWCMNTRDDTVLGQMEGEQPVIEEMKKWLSTTGSPSSRIDRAEFRNEKTIENYSFKDFSVQH